MIITSTVSNTSSYAGQEDTWIRSQEAARRAEAQVGSVRSASVRRSFCCVFLLCNDWVVNDLGCITGGVDILLMNRARQGFFETFAIHARG